MDFGVFLGIFFLVLIIAAVLFFISRVAWAAVAAVAAIILLIFALNVRAEERLDDRLSLFTPPATQTIPSESPDDQGTCEKGGFTVSSTRGFCDEVDGEFTLASATNPQLTPTASRGAIPQGGGQAEATATTQLPTPTTAPPAPIAVTGNADVRAQISDWDNYCWHVTTYEGVTEQMNGWLSDGDLKCPDPGLWPTFPNVDNPNAGFEARNGLYYGLDERAFCDNDICDLVVQARGYNLVSGDYDLGFISCQETNGVGCAFVIFNVGNESANFEDIHVNSGFSVADVYFNGKELGQAMWGVSSHTIAAMLNYPIIADTETGKVLNDPSKTNAGANCSVPEGCGGVNFKIVVTSGNQVLAVAETTFMRP